MRIADPSLFMTRHDKDHKKNRDQTAKIMLLGGYSICLNIRIHACMRSSIRSGRYVIYTWGMQHWSR